MLVRPIEISPLPTIHEQRRAVLVALGGTLASTASPTGQMTRFLRSLQTDCNLVQLYGVVSNEARKHETKPCDKDS